jgi:hypothetical protein
VSLWTRGESLPVAGEEADTPWHGGK